MLSPHIFLYRSWTFLLLVWICKSLVSLYKLLIDLYLYYKIKRINPKKNCVIGFGITEKTISNFKNTDGLVVGSQICKEITRSLNNRQNPVINVSKMVSKLRKKISWIG